MRRIAIIPARGGSVRIPRKAIRDFRGKPMMQRAIEAALYSTLFDQIVVSTDSTTIEEIALSLGCVVHRRPVDDGARGTQEVAAEVLRHDMFESAEEACVIYPCAPMLLPSDLQQARADMNCAGALRVVYAMSVLTNPLADAGMFYFGLADAFRNGAPLIHQHTIMIPIPPERGIDINTEFDWLRAEIMFDALRSANEE